MADSIQERIKKQKEEAERRLQEQAKSGALPSTPGGVAGLGATADQAKMAGTPNAKIGTAAQIGLAPPVSAEPAPEEVQPAEAMRDVSQDDTLQTELGEKTFDDQTRDAAQERAAKFSQDMAAFGSLGQRVETMVTGAFSGVTQEGELKNLAKDVGFEIEDVQNLLADNVSEEDMRQLLSDFSDIGRTDDKAAFDLFVQAARDGMFKNPHSGMMDFVDKAYKKDKSTMRQTVANLVANDIIDPDQVTFEQLINSGFVNVDDAGVITELGVTTDDLQEILGPDWMNLTPDQIGEEVESSRQELLDNKAQIEEQLSDPDLPPQTRVALLDELKRMGAIGAIEYEQRAEEAQAEAATSGHIIIGGEVQDVAELLQDEEIKEDVVNYLSDPESDMAKEWKRLNPDFANWIERELESLNITKKTLETNIENFETIQRHNEDFVARNLMDRGGHLSKEIMNVLGYGDQAFEIQNYQAGDDPVYDMLSQLGTGEGGPTTQAVNILNDIARSAPDQLSQFKGLAPDKLRELLTTPGKMEEFAQMAKMRTGWQNVRNSGNVDAMADLLLGGGNTNRNINSAGAVKSRMAELYVQAKLGGNPEVMRQYELMKTLFDANGDGRIDDVNAVRSKIDALLSKEGDLKGIVDRKLSGKISDFRNMGDTGYSGNIWNTIKNHIGGGSTPTTISDQELDFLGGQLDIHALEQLKDPKLAGVTDPVKVDRVMRNKAKKNIDTAATDFSGMSDQLKFGVGNTSHTQADHNVTAFRKSKDALAKLAQTGHPYEREEANKALSHMLYVISNTKKDIPWGEFKTARGQLRDNITRLGATWRRNAPEHAKIYFDRHGGVSPELVYKWAVWRNYADDPNDMKTFFNNMVGKW